MKLSERRRRRSVLPLINSFPKSWRMNWRDRKRSTSISIVPIPICTSGGRDGAVLRSRTILKQFVPDPEERPDYYALGGLEGKIVLDPNDGGGTTLHEAIRLGANVIGADIDPIPVAQVRATLTQVELADLQIAFNQFFAQSDAKVGIYFQLNVQIANNTGYPIHFARFAQTDARVARSRRLTIRVAPRSRSHVTDLARDWEINDESTAPKRKKQVPG